jgi:xanthine dehydrogenase accessory protein XdhC
MSYIEVRVAEARGSVPREPGTRMWVGADEVRGTIGGGNLEYTALKIAREMLLSGETRRERRIVLGDSLGQCCGGSVLLRFTKTEAPALEEIAFHAGLFGAGHVGKEVARILERLPCALTWVDPRPDVFPARTTAEVAIEEEPAWRVDDAPAGAHYLVMTHSHALDFDIVERVLRRKDFGFLGLIGSETKAAKFKLRLQAKGISPDRLVCPVGLFKAGKHPAEVAVSAVAQLLARSAQVPVGRTLESVARP